MRDVDLHQIMRPYLIARPFVFVCAALIGVSSASGQARAVLQQVLVQPIILQGDDGGPPARARIAESLIDKIFAAAKIDLHFTEPITYNNSQIRDGFVKLNEIVALAERDGILRSNGEMVNLFFVSKLEDRSGPTGVGQSPDWISVVALGDKTDDNIDASTVARAIAENMGLPPAANDPLIVDRTGNLMSTDLTGTRLAPHQIEKLRGSPLIRQHVECLSVDEASAVILDDSYVPYFSQLQLLEIATITGKPATGTTLEGSRQQARERFVAAVRPFSERETEAVTWFVGQLEEVLRVDFPLFAQHPWRFIKFHGICGGFSHTRGTCIFFSDKTVDRIVAARHLPTTKEALRKMGTLFTHEQLHVFERMYPSRFASLFQEHFGFVRADVIPHAWLDERQISNPDALKLEWIISEDSRQQRQWYWLRTLLRTNHAVPQMGKDFLSVAVRVGPDQSGRYRVVTDNAAVPVYKPIDAIKSYVDRFPMRRVSDHPNELAAYMFQFVLMHDYVLNPNELPADAATRIEPAVAPFREWCRANLR